MRIESLTIFRFIAAAIVVIYHFGKEDTGFRGILIAGQQMVTFFFVLSGFVLTLAYCKKDISKTQFWWDRATRIGPVYFVSLILMVFSIILQGKELDPLALLLNVLLLQAWVSPYPLTMNPVGWSLSVEAFFYFIFPFVFIVINKYRPSTLKLMTIALLTWVSTEFASTFILTRGLQHGFPWLIDIIYYFPVSHICSFLIGISGALWFNQHQYHIKNNFISMFFVAGAIFLVVSAINYQTHISNFFALHFAFGSSFFAPLFLLLVITISICRSQFMKVASLKPMVLLGDASYSLYILQFPVFQVYTKYLEPYLALSPPVNFAVFFGLLTLISIGSFLLFEKPANRFLRHSLPILFRSWRTGH